MILLPRVIRSRNARSMALSAPLVAATLLVITLVGSGAAHAQGFYSQLRVEQLRPSSPGSPFTRAEGPHDKFDEGIGWGARLALDYGLNPLETERIRDGQVDDASSANPVEHALLGHLGGSISPLYWLNIELDFAFAMYEGGDAQTTVLGQNLDPGKAGQGDIRVGAHGRVLSTDDLDISIGTRVWFPTGSTAAYMTGDNKFIGWELTPAVAGELDLARYGCTLGLAPLFFAGRDGDRLAVSCAVHFKVAPMVSLGIEPHLAVFSYVDGNGIAPVVDNSKAAPGLGNDVFRVQFEPLGAAQFHIGDFSVGVAAGPGISNAPGAPGVRAMAMFSYSDLGKRVVKTTGPKDSDLDGIPDKYDACPEQAGSKDRRGCPSKRDLDGDGIIEGDACPDDPGASYDDPEANGCPDGDNDHFADPVDKCPDEPGPTGGCPKFARLRGDEFVVDPPVAFTRGRTELDANGKAAFVEIIQTMRANPKLEQVSVAIGSKGTPQRVTDKRAAALLELFNEQNLDSNRYEVVLSDDLRAGQIKIKVIR